MADPDATVMETFVVEASINQPWKYVALPGYEILSQCDEAFTQRFARAVIAESRARDAFLPESLWGEAGTPVRIILYNRPPSGSENVLERNPTELAWSADERPATGNKTVFVSHPYIVSDGDVVISCANYWGVGDGLDNLNVDVDSSLRLARRVPQLPAWLLAGIQGEYGLYRDHRIETGSSRDVLVLLPQQWISVEKTIELRTAFEGLKKEKKRFPPPAILPLASVFSYDFTLATHDLWESECALFVRWVLFGRHSEFRDGRAALAEFAEATSHQLPSEALFRKAFGMGYEKAEEQLADYIGTALLEPVRVPLSDQPAPAIAPREATSARVATMIGSWLRIQASVFGPFQFSLKEEYLERSEKMFRRERQRSKPDTDFLAEYGLFAAARSTRDDAIEALTYATAHDVIRPRAFVELARLKLKGLLSAPDARLQPADRGEYHHIMTVLLRAKHELPGYEPTYEAMAELISHAPDQPTLDDLAPLEQAVHLFPKKPQLAETMAAVYSTYGYDAKAAEIVAWVRQFALPKDSQTFLSEYGYR